jgi:hypothetical protein
MMQVYSNAFGIFVSGDGPEKGMASIEFKQVYKYGETVVNCDNGSKVPGSEMLTNTETVASIIMTKENLLSLRDSINNVIDQINKNNTGTPASHTFR